MEIWGLKTCDTCRKAVKALPDAVFRDVRAKPLDNDEIAQILTAFGESAVNKASTTWRGLADAEKMATYPALMKRPVIWAADGPYLGWTPKVRAAMGVT